MAIIYEVEKSVTVNCRDNVARRRQNVVIVDDTLKACEDTLWAEFCDLCDGKEGKCIMLQNLQIRDVATKRTLTTTASTIIQGQEEVTRPEQAAMDDWFDESGIEEEFDHLRQEHAIQE